MRGIAQKKWDELHLEWNIKKKHLIECLFWKLPQRNTAEIKLEIPGEQ